MKILHYILKSNLLTYSTVMLLVILALLLILGQTKPIFWQKMTGALIKQAITSATNQEDSSNIISGELVELETNSLKIKTSESYYSVIADDKTIIKNSLFDDNKIELGQLKIGDSVAVKILQSIYQSQEPFTADYIILIAKPQS